MMYFRPDDEVVSRINATDFLLFNIAESFFSKPSYNFELTGMTFDVNFPDKQDVYELVDAMKEVVPQFELPGNMFLARVTAQLLTQVKPTNLPVEEMDDYDLWTVEDILDIWCEIKEFSKYED